MTLPGKLSIKTKLILIICSVSIISLCLVFAIYAIGETRHLRKTLEEETLLIARTIGEYAIADLTFKDKKAATETLEKIQSIADVTYAALYDEQGHLFASYGNNTKYQKIKPLKRQNNVIYTETSVIVSNTIKHNNLTIGSTVIEMSTQQLGDKILNFILFGLTILLGMIILSYILASKLQRIISTPIMDLTEKTKQVQVSGDFSIRAKKYSADEIGILSDSFNLMLGGLQFRQTQRNKAEQALRDAKNNLELTVQERTHELETANQELKAFSYAVSHDLRAPLRGIDGFSKILLEDYTAKLDAEGIDYLQRIRNATTRMGEIIQDLLTLSRVTQAELNYEDVDVTQLCHSIFNSLQLMEVDHRDIEINIEDNIHVFADKTLLTLALDNLIGNAWKYTGKQEKAIINISASKDDDSYTINIRDNGVGFDMAYAEKLFAPMQRLHAPSEFDGTGIGLATVYRILSKHGATIRGEGVVNQGASFSITFPVKPAREEQK